MKLLKKWALLLLTLLLTAAGAGLPWVISGLQDAQVGRTPETRQFDPVNLTLREGGGVQETLLLLAGSYSDLEWNGRTNLSGQEAADAAREAVRLLHRDGLYFLSPEDFGEDSLTVSVEPHIMMSMTESSVSAIVWLCWIDQLPDNWIFIDDDTGKMVRVFLFGTETNLYDAADVNLSASGWEADPEVMTKLAEAWRESLSDYYGIELSFSESEVSVDAYSSVFKLHCDGGELRLEIAADGTVYFNP